MHSSGTLEQRDELRALSVQRIVEGDLNSAVDNAKLSYSISQELFGPEHEELLPECLLLSRAYWKLGVADDAKLYLNLAASLAEKDPYQDPATNADLFRVVAEMYLHHGDTFSAERMYTQYCGRTEYVCGLDDLRTCDCYNTLCGFHMQR